MQIVKAPEQFRPVSITLETQDELDKLTAIIAAVSQNAINHPPQLIRAAADILRELIADSED